MNRQRGDFCREDQVEDYDRGGGGSGVGHWGLRQYRVQQAGVGHRAVGKVVRGDLTSQVTASGEIKPKNYINIGANAAGIITELPVKEGERVHRGELLAKLEDVQPAAT